MNRRRWRAWLATVVAAGIWSASADAEYLWRSAGTDLARIDTVSGDVRTIAPFPAADEVEPDDAGGAWVRVGKQVIRIESDLSQAVVAPLPTVPAVTDALWQEARTGGIWAVAGDLVVRIDAGYREVSRLFLPGPVRGFAVAGPRAVWVATDAALVRFDESGRPLQSLDLGAAGIAGGVRGLLVDPRRARLWIVAGTSLHALSAETLQRPIDTVAVGNPTAAALDPESGRVLLLYGRTWVEAPASGAGPSGTFAAASSFGSAGLVEPARVVVPSGAPALPATPPLPVRTTAASGAVVFGAQSTSPEVRPALQGVVRLAGSAMPGGVPWLAQARSTAEAQLGPGRLEGENVASAALTAEIVGVCDDHPCSDAAALLDGARATVEFDGAPVADVAILPRGAERAVTVPLHSLAPGRLHEIVLRIADAWGNETPPRRLVVDVGADGRIGSRRVAAAAPTVAITAPAANASFVAPASITISASASATGATVSKVEFYRDGVLLAADATSPWSYAWTGVAVGTYVLTAKAYDSLGGTATSSPVTVVVKANVAPTVALTSPANNAAYTAPASVDMIAAAADSDGTVAKVEFYNGTTRLATLAAAPWRYTWTNVAGGAYSLTARATDDKGAMMTSAPVSITVNRPPTVALTSPAGGGTAVAPASVVLTASAADSDGTVAKVEFFQGSTLLGTDTASPWTYTWSNVAPGAYSFTARATDNKGAATTSAPVAFTVTPNAVPSVALTSPAGGATFVAPASIALAATATDADGTIAKVEFMNGNAVVATDATSPYTYQWNNVVAGSYTLTARATDNKNGVTQSTPVTITVKPNQPPTITLAGAPAPGTLLVRDGTAIALTADARDADGTVARVRFYVSEDLGAYSNFATATAIPFAATYTIAALPYARTYRFYAEAVDNGGAAVASAEIEYQVVPDSAPLAWLFHPAESQLAKFVAPATIVLVAGAFDQDAANTTDAVARVEFIADGNVLAAMTTPNGSAGEYVWVWRNAPLGSHAIVVRATDSVGLATETDAKTIDVVPPAAASIAVTLSQPASGASYRVADGVPLQASVTGAIAPIAAVEYTNAIGARVASVAVPPYAATWVDPPPGLHSITAHAVDTFGNVTTSPSVFFEVMAPNRRPVVVLTSPVALNAYPANVPITLAVDAVDPDGTVAKVDFLAGSTVIGSATTTPFRMSWSSPAAGKVTFTATATDNSGLATTSSPVTVTFVAGNSPPAVSITSPPGGATFSAPASITLGVAASDPDGAIAKVEYFAGGSLVATASAAPYAATWTAVPPGTWTITARATDSKGAATTSAPVTVTVSGAATAAITSPGEGARFGVGTPIVITANVVSPGIGIDRIEFRADGTALGAATVGGAPAATVNLMWNGAAAGPHSLSAMVVRSDGSTLSAAPVGIVVADLSVTVVEPFPWQTYLAPGTVRIAAAPAETGVAIARVDFRVDGSLVGTRTGPPWSVLWSGAPAGTHSVTAEVRDAGGATVVSAPVPIDVVVAPAVVVDSGIDGATIDDDNILLAGTARAPANSAVTVNGQGAALGRDGRFFVNGLRLLPGSNTVTLILNSQDAAPIVRTITVNGSAARPFQVTVEPASGLAPLDVKLRIVNRGNVAFKRITVDTNGDGTTELALDALADGEATIAVPYPQPGVYTLVVKVYDDSDAVIYQARRMVKAVAPAEIGMRVVDVYRTLVDRLAANDATGALRLFVGEARARYAEIFASLAGTLPAVAAQLGRLVDGAIGEDWAELTILRDTPEGTRVFMINLLRGGDGIWRMESM